MRIEVDLTRLPTRMVLTEVDDLERLSVHATPTEHTRIPIALLRELAAERRNDPAWRKRFEAMVAYADSQGWVHDDGTVRAHVERDA